MPPLSAQRRWQVCVCVNAVAEHAAEAKTVWLHLLGRVLRLADGVSLNCASDEPDCLWVVAVAVVGRVAVDAALGDDVKGSHFVFSSVAVGARGPRLVYAWRLSGSS